MKYRAIGLVVAIILIATFTFFIMPKLDLQNTWINLITTVIMFSVLATIGTITKNMDKR